MKNLSLYIVLTIILSSCLETQSSKGFKKTTLQHYTPPEKDIEIDSNTVFSVFKTALPAKVLARDESEYAQAKLKTTGQAYSEDSKNLDNIIQYSNALIKLGWYYEAIRVYSEGLDKNPTSYKLLKSRGQAYIIIRQFDLAIEDLQRAAFYSRPAKNEGAPTDALMARYAKNKSNEKFSIFFSLGMGHYLKGSYDKSISSFKQCLKYADNNDLLVLITDWFYLTYRKLGNQKAAEELLLSINRKTKVSTYTDYLNRILLYKGVYRPQNLLANAENNDNSLTPTLAYGVSAWYLMHGDQERAVKIFERILLSNAWDTYEYIATEVELKSLQP